jgi:hypothetical protein
LVVDTADVRRALLAVLAMSAHVLLLLQCIKHYEAQLHSHLLSVLRLLDVEMLCL